MNIKEQIQWRHGQMANQAICAIQVEADYWMLVGGTWKTSEAIKRLGCQMDARYFAYCYRGETLSLELLNLIDYVKPLGEETVSPQKHGFYINGYRPVEKRMIEIKQVKVPEKIANFVEPSWYPELLFYLNNPERYPVIVIVGPTGNGKTTAAVASQEGLSLPYRVIDLNEYIEPADLAGMKSYHPEQGDLWVNGSVTEAFERGQNIIMNEFDAANPRAIICLQSALQDGGYNGLQRYITTPGNPKGDRVFPAGACTMILTMNTYGSGANRHYTGRNALDQATLDRVAYIATGYENEDKILISRGYSRKTAENLIKWAVKARKVIDDNALKLNLSPRSLIRLAHMIEDRSLGYDQVAAIRATFLSRVEPDDRSLFESTLK